MTEFEFLDRDKTKNKIKNCKKKEDSAIEETDKVHNNVKKH